MMATRMTTAGAILLIGLAWHLSTALAEAPGPDEARLRAEVAALCAPEMAGRSGEGGRKAAEHLAESFRGLGLEPLFDGRYFQTIPDANGSGELGRNVGAFLRGSEPSLRDEWVVVSAHFDHLGERNGVTYPGADDNASGVAMMLEVARALVGSPDRPRRSMMFLGFDLEEHGLYGSRYFVEHPPVPIGRIALFLTADMLGRSLGGVCDRYVFVFGTEHAPGLRPWVAEASRGRDLTVGLLGSDITIVDRSDYGPFRARKVPYLFFSTGENPCYHSPRDVPETLDYPKLTAISRVILDVVRRAAGAEAVPKWSPVADNPLDEAVTIRNVLRRLLESRDRLAIGGPQAAMMTNALRNLDAIIARGSITPVERAGMVTMARIVMLSVL
jgi:hypothetical protein